MERTYALNDEAAVVVCDYGKASGRIFLSPITPRSWTGLEYAAAAMMMYRGDGQTRVRRCVANTRARYDGEKRNPWDEAECGHHYARAMSSWSTSLHSADLITMGHRQAVIALPRLPHRTFRSFWASGTGWGEFSYAPGTNGGTFFTLRVLGGDLRCRSIAITAIGIRTTLRVGKKEYVHTASSNGNSDAFRRR